MAINTPYLGSSATPGNTTGTGLGINTSYLSTGLTELTSALSVWGKVEALKSVVADSNVSILGLADLQSGRTQAGLLSYATTASATSVVLPDGAFGIYAVGASAASLVYRSGNTTYIWSSTSAKIL